MKILHVITGLENGGAEGVLYRLVAHDHEHIHIVVSLMDEGVYGERITQAGVKLYTVGLTMKKLKFSAIIRLNKIISNEKPDVVQTWMYHADFLGGILSKINRVKATVWGIRGPYNKERTSVSTKVIILMCAQLSRFVPDKVVSNSWHAIGSHARAGYRESKFSRIANGFCLKKFNPTKDSKLPIEMCIDIPNGSFVVGMVGRYDVYKDHDMLLRAIETVVKRGGNITCLLIGPGMNCNNAELVQKIKRCNLSSYVRLLGPVEDTSPILSMLDLHLLSSAAESFPNVLAEAMASGVPCVTTDVGDAAEIVGEFGWVVQAGDHNAFASAIIKAYEESLESEKWISRKQGCRKKIEAEYSLGKMLTNYKNLWRDLVNDRSSSRNKIQ